MHEQPGLHADTGIFPTIRNYPRARPAYLETHDNRMYGMISLTVKHGSLKVDLVSTLYQTYRSSRTGLNFCSSDLTLVTTTFRKFRSERCSQRQLDQQQEVPDTTSSCHDKQYDSFLVCKMVRQIHPARLGPDTTI